VWNRGEFATGTITIYFPAVSFSEKKHHFDSITRLVDIAHTTM